MTKLRKMLDDARIELDAAKDEPGHSVVEDRLIDCLDYVILALEEAEGKLTIEARKQRENGCCHQNEAKAMAATL